MLSFEFFVVFRHYLFNVKTPYLLIYNRDLQIKFDYFNGTQNKTVKYFKEWITFIILTKCKYCCSNILC